MIATARIKTEKAPPQAKTRSIRVAALPPAKIRTRARTGITITSQALALRIKIGKKREI